MAGLTTFPPPSFRARITKMSPAEKSMFNVSSKSSLLERLKSVMLTSDPLFRTLNWNLFVGFPPDEVAEMPTTVPFFGIGAPEFTFVMRPA